MILRSGGKDVELRDMFTGYDRIPRPSETLGMWTTSGKVVRVAEAVTLPTVMSCIRLLAETVGTLPLVIYREGPDSRERAPQTPQWSLLHDRPNDHQTPFQLWSYVVASMQGYGGAFLLKTKARGRVQELYPLDPQCIEVKVVGGALEFHYKKDERTAVILTRDDVVYIPALLWDNPYVGISPITAHRNALGTALALDEFESRFFQNDASPGGIISVKGNLQKDQRDALREGWEARHRGVGGAHKVGLLWGEAEYQQIGVNLQDAQFIEAKTYGVREICRIFRVPPGFLGEQDDMAVRNPLNEMQRFVQFSLTPWFVRIEQALHADDDLFPDKTLVPGFLPDALLRADVIQRYQAYLPARQAGWLSPNEIRRMEGLPPIDGGDEIQQTPVGGAPNDTGAEAKETDTQKPETQKPETDTEK